MQQYLTKYDLSESDAAEDIDTVAGYHLSHNHDYNTCRLRCNQVSSSNTTQTYQYLCIIYYTYIHSVELLTVIL